MKASLLNGDKFNFQDLEDKVVLVVNSATL